MKVLVLGAGKMVEAILLGLKEEVSLKDWSIYSPSGASAKELASKVGAAHAQKLEGIDPDWILIGCKPQQLVSLKSTLNGKYPNALYLSLLAAVDERKQREILGVERLIRAMPNLNVKFHEGITLISTSSAQNDLPLVQKLFSSLGEALVLEEKELEELTLLTGSGPALFYEFTKNLSDSFSSLDASMREKLARQLLQGVAESVKNEEKSLQSMIDAVTSKAGVTIAVLEKWREKNLRGVIKTGVERGLERTQEIKTTILQN